MIHRRASTLRLLTGTSLYSGMRAFMTYISYEMIVMYAVTAAMYVAATAFLLVALATRDEVVAAVILSPLVVLSWIGLFWQVAQVAQASADMRGQARGGR